MVDLHCHCSSMCCRHLTRMMRPLLALIVVISASALYGYSVIFILKHTDEEKAIASIPRELLYYGHWVFLTFHTLLFQLTAYLLHLLASYFKSLRNARDLMFTALAFPLSGTVFCAFWAVWHFMGRDMIMPQELDSICPPWLNHTIHTLIVPINLLTAVLVPHKYHRRGPLVLASYTLFYICLLYYVKLRTGVYLYIFLHNIDYKLKIVHHLATFLIAYLMYKLGQFLNQLIHADDTGSLAPQHEQQQEQNNPSTSSLGTVASETRKEK